MMGLFSVTFFYIDDSSDHVYIELDEKFLEKVLANKNNWFVFKNLKERKGSVIYNKEYDLFVVNLNNVTSIKVVDMEGKHQNLVKFKLIKAL